MIQTVEDLDFRSDVDQPGVLDVIKKDLGAQLDAYLGVSVPDRKPRLLKPMFTSPGMDGWWKIANEMVGNRNEMVGNMQSIKSLQSLFVNIAIKNRHLLRFFTKSETCDWSTSIPVSHEKLEKDVSNFASMAASMNRYPNQITADQAASLSRVVVFWRYSINII
jgi:hypothetical protein